MGTYYDFLRIQPTASAAEVEIAIQEQYDRWRRLVTHHDVNVVSQANLALSTLETIRATLADPPRRSAYDAGIGLGSTVGGLADPDAILANSNAARTPPASEGVAKGGKAASTQAKTTSETAWRCPRCQQQAETGQRYCFRCGAAISEPCPVCTTVNPVARPYCIRCGVESANASRIAHDISNLREEMKRLADERESKLKIVQNAEKLNASLNYGRAAAIGFLGAITLGLWIAVPHGMGVGYALLASLVLSVVCWAIMSNVGFFDTEGCNFGLAMIMDGIAWLAGAITWLWAAAVALFGGGMAAVKWNLWTNLAFFAISVGTTLAKAISDARMVRRGAAIAIEAQQQQVQLDDLRQRLETMAPSLR